jgi:hypothetical protein
MHGIKATMIFSLTTLILLAAYIAYQGQHERFVLLPLKTDKGIYVFDRKSNFLNYCTADNQCKLIKLNLPAEQESHEPALSNTLLRLLSGKQNAATEKSTDKKAENPSITVAATHAQTPAAPTIPEQKIVPIVTVAAPAPAPAPQPPK